MSLSDPLRSPSNRYALALSEYDVALEHHRKVAAEAEVQKQQHRERVRMMKLKEEVERTRRAVQLSMQEEEDFLDLDSMDVDGLLGKPSKKKRKLHKHMMTVYDENGNLVQVPAVKSKKKLKNSMKCRSPVCPLCCATNASLWRHQRDQRDQRVEYLCTMLQDDSKMQISRALRPSE